MSVTAHMYWDVEMQETNGNPPVRAWLICPDGGVEDRVPAMEREVSADIMQVSAKRTPLDINSFGSTVLSKFFMLALTPADRCAHPACQHYITKNGMGSLCQP